MNFKTLALSSACLLILMTVSILGAPIFSDVVPLASAQSCPSQDVLHMTFPGGAPNSFGLLTAATNGAFTLSYLLYYGLYPTLGPTGLVDYNLSIVDSINHNSNYTQWTFNITPGLKWSDGSNVTSQDILATYSSAYAFNASFDFTGVHKEVVSVTAPNSSTAVFTLNKADAHFPEVISQEVLTTVIPAAYVKQYGPGFTGFGTSISDGPFYVANYTAGQSQLVLLPNPYFNPKTKICQVDVNFVESSSQIATYLQSGATDLGGPLDPASALGVLRNPNAHLMIENGSNLISAEYNVTEYPFNTTAFRQALVFGINESQIVQQAYNGYGEPAYPAEGTVPPEQQFLYNPSQMKYSYDTKKALSLLSSIGIKMGSDGHLQYPNGTDVTLNIWTDSTYVQDTIASEVMQNNLQSLGFNINLQVTSLNNLNSFTALKPATMYVTSNTPTFPLASLDALPGWDVYSQPPLMNIYWEYPPNINTQYEGNLTAIQNTDNNTQLAAALFNIEALNAQYLPTIVLMYGPQFYGYTTQHWVNWSNTYPNGWIHMNSAFNVHQLVNIVPVGSATSTSTSTVSSSPSSASTASITTSSSSIATSLSSSASSSSTSSGGLPVSTLTLAAIVIVIIIIAAVAVVVLRRR